MKKRLIISFVVVIMLFITVGFKLYSLSTDETLTNVSLRQSSYELVINRLRGVIYDCNSKPLVYTGKAKKVLSVLPSIESTNLLKSFLPYSQFINIYSQLSGSEPFLTEIDDNINIQNSAGVRCFSVRKRYSNNQLCNHLIGYCSSDGNGISGVEKAMNEYLYLEDNKLSISYPIDANGNFLSGSLVKINNNDELKKQGVKLTIDRSIQKIAQRIAKRYIKKGAVIVTSVPDCKIKAMVSLPDYSAYDIETALQDNNSPLLNRALCAYDVGSVFKLITSATVLENYPEILQNYKCNGSISLGGNNFSCFNYTAHGKVDLEKALAYSCNGYFINLSKHIQPKDIYTLASAFGFGKSITLAEGLCSDKGNLPTIKDLRVKNALANLSFGQGSLLATPLQISAMINTIASGGKYTTPSLLLSIIDQNGESYNKFESPISRSVIEPSTAQLLQKYMCSVVRYGTGKTAKSKKYTLAGKTGTAQTGQFVNGKEVQQCWFAGFFPAENPKYTLVVLSENATSVASDCSPVFKRIAEKLCGKM